MIINPINNSTTVDVCPTEPQEVRVQSEGDKSLHDKQIFSQVWVFMALIISDTRHRNAIVGSDHGM